MLRSTFGRITLLIFLLTLLAASCVIVISPETSPTYTPYPTYTPQPAIALQPTPMYLAPTPTRDSHRADQWAVYAAPANDVNAILLNGHIIAVTYCCREKPDWTDISGKLRRDPSDELTFVNLNGPGYGDWGFRVWHNGEVVWENAGLNEQENTLGYAQAIQINSKSTLQPVTSTVAAKQLGDPWSVRIAAEDVGLILINGVPVAGSYSGGAKAPESPTPGLVDSGWIDIGHLLRSDQNNIISVVVWNRAGPYYWQASIRRGEEVVWQSNDKGQDHTGEIFSASLTIAANGDVLTEQRD